MRATILVIEDEEAINDLICMNLEAAGYQTVPCLDGEAASRLIREASGDGSSDRREQAEGGVRYDLALLDVMLPGKDGFALLPELKARGIPVIFLTAKGDVTSKVKGLREGAEDYLVKPFEMLELLVRMEKVLKRQQDGQSFIRIRNVTVYPEKRVVEKDGKEVPFTPMEFDCLLLLLENRNRPVTREQLLAKLWGVDFDGETRTIDVHIGRIRRKLDFGDVIRTIPRIGYRLEF